MRLAVPKSLSIHRCQIDFDFDLGLTDFGRMPRIWLCNTPISRAPGAASLAIFGRNWARYSVVLRVFPVDPAGTSSISTLTPRCRFYWCRVAAHRAADEAEIGAPLPDRPPQLTLDLPGDVAPCAPSAGSRKACGFLTMRRPYIQPGGRNSRAALFEGESRLPGSQQRERGPITSQAVAKSEVDTAGVAVRWSHWLKRSSPAMAWPVRRNAGSRRSAMGHQKDRAEAAEQHDAEDRPAPARGRRQGDTCPGTKRKGRKRA